MSLPSFLYILFADIFIRLTGGTPPSAYPSAADSRAEGDGAGCRVQCAKSWAFLALASLSSSEGASLCSSSASQ